MKNKLSWIKSEMEDLKRKGFSANSVEIDSPIGSRIKVNGKWLLNFCSNNYLGLANNLKLRESAKKAIDKYGIGPAAVRTIAGTTRLHLELEKRLSEFKKTEDVITFQSGFNANIAVIPAFVGKDDVIFSDELNHASIIDGCRLSKADIVRYKHTDVRDLELKIKNRKRNTDNRKLIITDGVFSMDGDIAPLSEICTIADKYNTLLMVDDAHGEGVLGEGGRGIVDHFHLHGKVDLEIGTLSKAFGVVGGFAAGKKEIIDYLKQRARPFLFSSAMTIPDVAAAIEAVKIFKGSKDIVERLWDNTNYFKIEIMNLGFDIGKSVTPIIPVMLGDAKIGKKFSHELFQEGVFAVAIGYPTVPANKARIRVMMSAVHSKKDLDEGLKAFEKVGRKLKIVR